MILHSEKPRIKDGVSEDLLPAPTGLTRGKQGKDWFWIRCLVVLAFFVGSRAIWKGMHRRDWHKDFDSYDYFQGAHRSPHHGPHGKQSVEAKEKLFLSVPNAESALATSRAWATHPHIAGSTEDFEDAKDILEAFQSNFGIRPPSKFPLYEAGSTASRDAILKLTSHKHIFHSHPTAWIDVYYPVLNLPLNRSLEILGEDGKPVWAADLVEDGDERDPEAGKYKDAVPTFHGFSADGDVTGELVYANYGTKEDYDELVAAGVNLKGKIVLVRYGDTFRGLKVKGAEELGAVGVLIYSDLRDDGTVTVANGYSPYPAGPARNPTSVQRGSVQFLSLYPGDPTTPGYPAYENATRVEGGNVPTIPSLPISWNNAERLLEEIADSTGGRLLIGGTSKAKIRLVNHVDTKVTPIWNTMAAIPGHIKDEVVVIGCHRDAWVMGAADPTSGTVSLHEIIRGFGKLMKHGWKPLRTIVFASWDAEEYGLVGSTEWGEDFSEWISEHVVSYLNVDVSVSGSRWNVRGSPSLAHLIHQTALDVPHPTIPGKTLWDARNDEGPFTDGLADTAFMKSYREAREQEQHATKTGVGALGSGSDYTVFLQRLGVASTDQGFGTTPSDAVYHYHSVYDSQRWEEVYGDIGFHRHVAVAKHLGLMALRLADSLIIPLNTTQYALELDHYLDIVEALIPSVKSSLVDSPKFSTLRESIGKLQLASTQLDEEKQDAEKALKDILHHIPGHHGKCHKRKFERVANWIKSVFGVRTEHEHDEGPDESVPHSLASDHERLLIHSPYLPHPRTPHFPHGFPFHKFHKAARRVQQANKKLIAFERGFISEGGIKDREWYKHLGVAPGKWLGYGATTLPALTEALTIDRNASAAEYEAGRLTDLIQALSARIKV